MEYQLFLLVPVLLSTCCYTEDTTGTQSVVDSQDTRQSDQSSLDSDQPEIVDIVQDVVSNRKLHSDGFAYEHSHVHKKDVADGTVEDIQDRSENYVKTVENQKEDGSFHDHKDSAKVEDKIKPARIVLQAFGSPDVDDEESPSDSERDGKRQGEEEVWTDETEETSEQKQTGGRRFFSLMNLIKFLLNPVIEEFQEVEKSSTSDDSVGSASGSNTDNSNKSEITSVSAGNSSETTDKEDKKNGTETGKKTKFQCVGRNVTENTTAMVRVVNSTLLLEVLSFDKNHSTSDCVLVMFYAPWCHFCAATAPHYNAIARAYPQLEVLAVDTVHFSNLNARFGTVAVPNIMLFHQSRSAVRFNHTERQFHTLLQFITNTTGLEANSSVELSSQDYEGPLSSTPSEETDYLLWFAWIFIIVCSGHIFISSQPGQRAIERVVILWQEHQHQHIE